MLASGGSSNSREASSSCVKQPRSCSKEIKRDLVKCLSVILLSRLLAFNHQKQKQQLATSSNISTFRVKHILCQFAPVYLLSLVHHQIKLIIFLLFLMIDPLCVNGQIITQLLSHIASETPTSAVSAASAATTTNHLIQYDQYVKSTPLGEPIFRLEPPNVINFSNETGAVIPCLGE